MYKHKLQHNDTKNRQRSIDSIRRSIDKRRDDNFRIPSNLTDQYFTLLHPIYCRFKAAIKNMNASPELRAKKPFGKWTAKLDKSIMRKIKILDEIYKNRRQINYYEDLLHRRKKTDLPYQELIDECRQALDILNAAYFKGADEINRDEVYN